MKRFFLLLLLVSAFLPSVFCADENAVKPTYKEVKDLPYYDANTPDLTPYQIERCKLDIYYQENGKDLPVVVWFHGGGLTGGNKAIPSGLKDKGIVVIAVNYRLSPQVKCPAYIEDAAAAIAWTFKHVSEYGGSPDKIFISGHSAGGYLVSMVGLEKKWLAKYEIDANKLAGIIPFSGQAITHLTIRKERGISDKQPVVDEFSPLFHVRADTPPILILSGDREKEMLGRYEENAYLLRMLKVNGNTVSTLYELQGYGHGMVTPGVPLLVEFVKKTLADKTKNETKQ
ncbi:MAG TPA: lipase [Lentisphaeria bacterium]|nr:MAG: lipase [Lentisphaerae bacterium GWF2_49_21]HBC89227.1 lipase [Lentisphaeria bacterium]